MIDLYHRLSDWVLDFAESDWAVLVLAINALHRVDLLPGPARPAVGRHSGAGPPTEPSGSRPSPRRPPSPAPWSDTGWAGGWADRCCTGWSHPPGSRPSSGCSGSTAPGPSFWRPSHRFPTRSSPSRRASWSWTAAPSFLASLAGRGARFFALGALVFFLGEEIEGFIADNFELLTVAVTAAVLLALAVVVLARRLRRKEAST